jgi:hypothetical protein
MDTLQRVKLTKADSINGYFYLWSGRGPLVQYLEREWKKDSTTPYFKRWASEAPLYQSYALYLIKKYPLEYAQRFLLPNAVKFAVPPLEFLGVYNMGADSVRKLAKDWFNYKTRKVKDHNKKDGPITMTEWFPVFSTLSNVLLILVVVGLLFFGGFRTKSPDLKLILLVGCLWAGNMAFSILASPIVLRYQVFPTLVCFALAAILAEKVYRMSEEQDRNPTKELPVQGQMA